MHEVPLYVPVPELKVIAYLEPTFFENASSNLLFILPEVLDAKPESMTSLKYFNSVLSNLQVFFKIYPPEFLLKFKFIFKTTKVYVVTIIIFKLILVAE